MTKPRVEIDITERRAAEAARRDSQARLQLALDAAGLAVWEVGPGGKIGGSPELNRLLGIEPGIEITRELFQSRQVPGEQERLREAAQKALAVGEKNFQAEFRLRASSGDVRWFLLRADIQFDDGGNPNGAIGVMMDITDRKAAEERHHLLMRELDHRVKNTLATVQAISHQTFRATGDMSTAMATFNSRLAALANAHGVLTSASWQSADVADIVSAALQPFRDPQRDRFTISGPSVFLSPQLALALAMTLHELCTNAAKYGALSVPSGSVRLWWQVAPSPPRLTMQWSEADGPPVAPPKKTGFGSRLITGGLAHAGRVQVDYRPTGVVCTIDIALELPAPS